MSFLTLVVRRWQLEEKAHFNSGTFVGVACLYDRTARTGLPTPAVPVRVAPASRQSKWAGPRVSALGTALATAPFLIAVSRYPQTVTPRREASGREAVQLFDLPIAVPEVPFGETCTTYRLRGQLNRSARV